MMVCLGKKCALLLSFVAGVATLAPYGRVYMGGVVRSDGYGFPRYERVVMVRDQRGFWDFLGDWIQNSNWFPVEINIPDTFGSITTGISNFTSGIIQRIPFLNNNNNAGKPVMVLLPVFRRRPAADIPGGVVSTMETIKANHYENVEGPNKDDFDKNGNANQNGEMEIYNSGEEIMNDATDSGSTEKKGVEKNEELKQEDVRKHNNYRNDDHVSTIENGNNVVIRKMLDEDGFWAYL